MAVGTSAQTPVLAVAAGSTTVTATLGSTPTTGNIIVAIASATSTFGTLSISGTGWTQITGSPWDTGADVRVAAWWKPADSTTGYTVTSTSNDNLALMLDERPGLSAVPLLDTTAPVKVSMTSSGASIGYGSFTPTAADTVTYYVLVTQANPGGSGPTIPGAFTALPAWANRRMNIGSAIGAPATYSGTQTWATAAASAQTLVFALAPSSASGTVAVTLEDAVSAASGSTVGGTVATTLADATMSAAGVHTTAGTIAATLDDVTLAAAGEHAGGVTGTIAVTLDGAAIEASGIHSTVGTIAVTLDAAAGSAAGTHTTVGSVAVTLDDATMSASGAITYTGTIAVTLADAAMDAAGGPEQAGQVTTTLDDATMAAYGDVVDLQAIIHMYRRADREFALGVKRRLIPRTRNAQVAGSVAVTLADATMGSTAVHAVAGTVEVTLADTVSSCDGTVGVIGAGAFLVSDVSASAAGDSHPAGTIAVTLDDATMSASGAPEIAGTITVTLDDAASTAAGLVGVTGTVAAAIADVAAAMAGGHGVAGPATATLDGATMAALGSTTAGGAGLDLAGVSGEYAFTSHAAALNASTGLDVIVLAALDDWTGAATQALIGKWDQVSGNQRGWDLTINSAGTVVFNLSATGSTVAAHTGTPAAPLVNGQNYWIRGTWTQTGGVTAVYAVAAASVSEPVPTSWGSPIATATKLSGNTLHPTTADLIVGAINAGTSLNAGGFIRYAEVRHAVGGPPVWRVDMRLSPDGASSFTDTVAGRTLSVVRATSSVPVGMPNGEAANVGPTADVLGHTPSPYSALNAQVATMVITTADANAQPTTEVTSDGVTRRVFEKLNVLWAVDVTSSTPILIRNSKIGMMRQQGADVWVEWTDFGRSVARAGDNALAASFMSDCTETVASTSATIAGATTAGAGAETVTVSSDGKFMDANITAATGKTYIYRCNLWGCTDTLFVGGSAEVQLVDSWCHDYWWVPLDNNRKNQSGLKNSHLDIVKMNQGNGLRIVGCRVDMWPITSADFATLPANGKGPHWGKNPNARATWPLQLPTVSPGSILVGTGYVNVAQATGVAKNIRIHGNRMAGPVQRYFYFLDNGNGYPGPNVTISANVIESDVTQAGTAWTQPSAGLWSIGASGTIPSTKVWKMPVTGANINTDEGVLIAHPRAGIVDSDAFTAT